MKNVPVAALAALSTATLAGTFAARPLTNIQAASTSGYEEVKNWPRLPAGIELGECAGVAVDANGRVFVFHRPRRRHRAISFMKR